MTMNAQTKRREAAQESPADADLRKLAEAIAALDREDRAIEDKLTTARAMRESAEAPANALAELEALHARIIEAQLTGDRPPADRDDVLERIAAKAAEAASQTATLTGTSAAIDSLLARRNDLATRRGALTAQRHGLLYRQAVERQVAMIEPGEAVTAALESWWVGLYAVSLVRDLLRPVGVPPCARGLPSRFNQLAPYAREFETFARERDLSDRIEARAAAILNEMGVDRSKLGHSS
jgi:hypothetical protein